jgi:hypothetical protein
MGKTLMILGASIFFFGALLHFSESTGWFKSIGNLPGDIKVEKENFRFYAPLGSSILLSLLLSLLFYIWGKFK